MCASFTSQNISRICINFFRVATFCCFIVPLGHAKAKDSPSRPSKPCTALLQPGPYNQNAWKFFRLQQAKQSWNSSAFTNPKNHNPNKYIYIVHTTTTSKNHSLEDIIRYLNDPAQEPKNIISASVVSSDGNSIPFGSTFGLILSTPTENILAASTHDLTVLNDWEGSRLGPNIDKEQYFKSLGSRDKYEESLFYKFGLPTPQSIVSGEMWNEVAINKVGSDGSIRVIGLFYCDKGYYRTSEHQMEEFRSLSAQFNIPLVPLKFPDKPRFGLDELVK